MGTRFIDANNHEICLSQVYILTEVTLEFMDGNISQNQPPGR
jgi:hypothetical protein